MRPHRALFLAALFISGSLLAQPLAIFSRTDAQVVGTATTPAPTDPAQAAFFAAYSSARAAQRPYPAELPVVDFPQYGKTISAHTGGTVHYLEKFPHGFVCHLQLHDLAPDHTYILTLNGNPEKAGNDLLPTPVPGNEKEKYYDFLDVKSDAHGRYDGELGIFLKPGAYNVRLYVKDTVDFKIVLYRDFFPFTVE